MPIDDSHDPRLVSDAVEVRDHAHRDAFSRRVPPIDAQTCAIRIQEVADLTLRLAKAVQSLERRSRPSGVVTVSDEQWEQLRADLAAKTVDTDDEPHSEYTDNSGYMTVRCEGREWSGHYTELVLDMAREIAALRRALRKR